MSSFTYSTNYKDALKYGFYELQSARDWYWEATSDVRISCQILDSRPCHPRLIHCAAFCRTRALRHPAITYIHPTCMDGLLPRSTRSSKLSRTSGQWSSRPAMSKHVAEEGEQDQEDGRILDPKLPKSLRIYVATSFPEWLEC
jgi:leucyl-tRNA synthetase